MHARANVVNCYPNGFKAVMYSTRISVSSVCTQGWQTGKKDRSSGTGGGTNNKRVSGIRDTPMSHLPCMKFKKAERRTRVVAWGGALTIERLKFFRSRFPIFIVEALAISPIIFPNLNCMDIPDIPRQLFLSWFRGIEVWNFLIEKISE